MPIAGESLVRWTYLTRDRVLRKGTAISNLQTNIWRRCEPGIAMMAALVLSPVLFAQGLVTRASVPKLPEPPGARDGEQGSGPPLRLLVLGDSAAAGVGASHQDDALLGQLVTRLSQDFQVSWRLAARTGNTTASALEWLAAQPPQSFDVAVTSLGVNDVTGLVRREKWRRQQRELRLMLQEKFGVKDLLISGLPPMHGFPALPQPLRWVLGSRATQFNDDLLRDLVAEEAAVFLDLRFTADTSFMARDGFHPGPEVYAEWAERAAAIIRNSRLAFAG